MKRLICCLKDRRGSSFPFVIAVTLVLMLIMCGFLEFYRLKIIANTEISNKIFLIIFCFLSVSTYSISNNKIVTQTIVTEKIGSFQIAIEY